MAKNEILKNWSNQGKMPTQEVVARQDSQGVHLKLNGADVHFKSVQEAQAFLKKNVKGFLPMVSIDNTAKKNPWWNDKLGAHKAYFSGGRKTKSKPKTKAKSNPRKARVFDIYERDRRVADAEGVVEALEKANEWFDENEGPIYIARRSPDGSRHDARWNYTAYHGLDGGLTALRDEMRRHNPWWNDKEGRHERYYAVRARAIYTTGGTAKRKKSKAAKKAKPAVKTTKTKK